MKFIYTIEQLEEVLSKHWFNPERRLYIWLLKQSGEKNRRRYAFALYKKLLAKGVVMSQDLLEYLIISKPEMPPHKMKRRRGGRKCQSGTSTQCGTK